MIYTFTASPTLDLVMTLPSDLENGRRYRAETEEIRPGGRGINISIVLKNLGLQSTALGFVAGFSGDELMRLTAESGIHTGFIRVRRGRTRVNLKLISPSATTKINGLGPVVTENDIDYMRRKIGNLMEGDILIIAGNISPSMPQDIYSSFMEIAKDRGVRLILDCPPELWENALKQHPFLIKTNLGDLITYTHAVIPDNFTEEELAGAAKVLIDRGAQNALISLSSKGALLIGKNNLCVHIPAPEMQIIDKVGDGDAMIAGFIADYIKNHDLVSAATVAVAAGTATASVRGLASAEQVKTVREKMPS